MATVVTRTRLNALITQSSGTTLISLHVCTCLRLTEPHVDKKVKDENSHKTVARSDTYVPLFFPYLLTVIQYRGPASGKTARVPTWYCSVWRHTPVRATSRSRTLARSGHNVCSPLQRVVSPCVCVCLHKPFLTTAVYWTRTFIADITKLPTHAIHRQRNQHNRPGFHVCHFIAAVFVMTVCPLVGCQYSSCGTCCIHLQGIFHFNSIPTCLFACMTHKPMLSAEPERF
jgi:hypothetical protein